MHGYLGSVGPWRLVGECKRAIVVTGLEVELVVREDQPLGVLQISYKGLARHDGYSGSR